MLNWLLLLIISLVYSDNITHEDNLAIKRDCGAHYLKERHARSIGGKEAQKNEYPWMAALFKRRVILDYPHWQIEKDLCSAVQISQRHLLTAAHCVVRMHQNVKRCDTTIDKKYRYVVLLPTDFIVIVGSACPNLAYKSCWSRRNVYTIEKIIVHPDHDPCKIRTDLALVVLSRNISSRDGLPICLPSKNESMPKTMTAVGFGLSPPSKANKLRSVDLNFYMRNGSRIITVTVGKSICKGDSGGPLAKVDTSDIYTVMAIGSASKPSCDDPYRWQRSFFDFFENIVPYVDWICQNTGVCPVTKDDEASE